MKRRNFLVGWITSILYAIFPSLRPKPMIPSWWQDYAKWDMVRSYDLRWHVNVRTTFDNPDVENDPRTGTTGGMRVTPAS